MSRHGETHIPHLVAESRRAQGLPDHVEDPAALARVVALLKAAEPQAPNGSRRPTCRRRREGASDG